MTTNREREQMIRRVLRKDSSYSERLVDTKFRDTGPTIAILGACETATGMSDGTAEQVGM